MTPPLTSAQIDPRALARFAGSGGHVASRTVLLVTAHLTVLTDTTVSDGTSTDTDDVGVARHPVTGTPIIPATGLTGALRARLRRTAAVSAEVLNEVFGHRESPARFRPRDAVAGSDHPPLGRRDGVVIDPGTETAMAGLLFSQEVVPAGTTFDLVWEIDLPTDAEVARPVAAVVAAAATALEGGIGVGQRTHAGRGRIRADRWSARLFDLAGNDAHVELWYSTTEPDQPALTPAPNAEHTPSQAISMALAAAQPNVWTEPLTEPDLTDTYALVLNVGLHNGDLVGENFVPSPLLIGGTASVDNVSEPLTRPWIIDDGTVSDAAIDSGASTRNLLRRTTWAALTALTTIAPARHDCAVAMFVDLFGSHPADRTDPTASRLHVDEAAITEHTSVELMLTPINPLTQGVRESKLASTRPLYGGRRALTITVQDPTDVDVGMLVLAIRDLVDGFAPASGADTGTGNGRRHIADVRARWTRPPTSASEQDHITARAWDSWEDILADPWIRAQHRHLVQELTGA